MNGVTPPIAGPNVIGYLAAVARGAYTDIVDIIAPSEAAYGDQVDIEVQIKNIWTDYMYISSSGKFDNTTFYLFPDYATVGAGETYPFSGSFSMPNHDVRIYVWSFFWTGEEWYEDDYGYVDIALAAPPEVYEGTISRKELEYDESRAYIPAYDIPQNERGLVHIWGRNDTGSYQTLGIGWVVTDPDGQEVERHEDDWAAGWVGAGQDREFLGGRFNLDKVGTYRIAIALYMNSADPVEVDIYYGDLCTVAAVVPEAEFRGFGIEEYQPV